MATAGVIGLGAIGGGVATCLARAGMLTAVNDLMPDIVERWPTIGQVTGSNAAVGRLADTILIAVLSADQVIEVLSGDDGVLTQARPGMNIVVLSTVSLTDLGRIRVLTDAAGVGLIDSGVTGGPKAAENGLICLVGGDEKPLAAVMPVLDAFARSVSVMGGPGAGMAAKIARNIVVYGSARAGYEAAKLCRAAGIDVHQLTRVIEDSADAVGGPMMMMGRPLDPLTDAGEGKLRLYVLGQLDKDLAAAIDLGATLGVDLPLAKLTRDTGREVVGLDG
ncbi:NAD(P)-dependent oxidoreductase [Sphingomonas sp. 28-63-12]|uniref:NAD(P)-dependent oxidoreductase n=1 Tax=Sphingomonas sp. 28-63-12 TaxID=1970434 RepID=UPI0035A8E914